MTSAGVLLSISKALVEYHLFHYFESWYDTPRFQPIKIGKELSDIEFKSLRMIQLQLCNTDPDMHMAQT